MGRRAEFVPCVSFDEDGVIEVDWADSFSCVVDTETVDTLPDDPGTDLSEQLDDLVARGLGLRMPYAVDGAVLSSASATILVMDMKPPNAITGEAGGPTLSAINATDVSLLADGSVVGTVPMQGGGSSRIVTPAWRVHSIDLGPVTT